VSVGGEIMTVLTSGYRYDSCKYIHL